VGSRIGVSTEKIEALNDYAKSPLFSDAEKVALEYADAITDTRRDVDDELFARLQRHYDDDTIAELTMIIAWENASSRFNRAFRIPRKGSGSDDRSGPRARPRPAPTRVTRSSRSRGRSLTSSGRRRESSGPLPVADLASAGRTALTLPLLPPPQKNRSPPSDSSPETSTPGGISSLSRTLPFEDRLASNRSRHLPRCRARALRRPR
jgi:hypothetical protein